MKKEITNIFSVPKTLAERRAKFAYEAARVENAMAKRPINPEPWEKRDEKFRKNMIMAVSRQGGKCRMTSPEKLHDDYDVKHGLQVVDKKSSNEKLLVSLNQTHKDIKYLVGLSRLGFNEDFTQSLTYVEFYGMDKLLQRKYVLISWEGSMVKETKWFSAE